MQKENFTCLHCGHLAQADELGARNHCPQCLYSFHTDIFPGDNAHECHSLMAPVGTFENEEGQLLVIHKCTKCGKSSRAAVRLDDNYEEILKLL